MKNTKTKINSLYIHIPFCSSICFYCDFPKILKLKKYEEKYIDALLKELGNLNINHKLKTIYIGGGTPSCICLDKLFSKLKKYIDKSTEFTVEANPLDINKTLLINYKKNHVNRLSLGVQSTNDKILKVLGRRHTKKDVIKTVNLAKKYIKNINIDLIYGFKELTNKILSNEINDYLKLNVDHISTYSLEIHKGTKFYNDHRKEEDDLIADQFKLIYKSLSKKYNRYEISNFSKSGYESKHNLTYWNDEQYYGIGLGAASYINNYRYKNTLNIDEYLKGITVKEKELITKNDDKHYYLLLNLRKTSGINLLDYKKRFNEDLLKTKSNEINKLIKDKLLIKSNNFIKYTFKGSLLLDIILRELF